jgi:hypothetical protein
MLVAHAKKARSGSRRSREVDVPDRAEFAKEIEELLWSDVEAAGLSAHHWLLYTGRTHLRFLTKRALRGNDMLAEVVCWPQPALRSSTPCGEGGRTD